MRMVTGTCAAMLLAGMLAGCPKYTEPVPRVRELSTAERNFETLWQASLRVLRRYRFQPTVQDRREGVIRTSPMTSQHFTEFWRPEATTSLDVIEGSLHTVYRTVRIKIVPAEPDSEKFKALVQVDVARSDRRAPHVTSASQAYELFSMAAEEKLKVQYGEEADEKPAIVPLGRDKNLEGRLAAEISIAAGQPLADK